ncbi:FGGY-family carbohydrate kinase [Phytohabitans rumicis]|uniref:Carbohydrate kinase n=1 Tax=Phytohabitans rumicis TaxID=1076125 RepID=A0A6V8L2T4_9ACTN|nr:FGGY-family carbohydrate kinase [Phytohabitans rumicis]GFJ87015.1 carbohydrate kinase [Phytohabitans rumicis]
MTGYLLGIDAGQTVTKAALFDTNGHEIAVASAETRTTSPAPRWQERDMNEAWTQTAEAIRRCLDNAAVDTTSVRGVGVCAHGDGLYLVDADLRPVRPAILATDSRAQRYADRYRHDDALLRLTGQAPAPYNPAPMLAWLRDHEPQALRRARWTLFCKDWIRLRLTGEVATDPSDASAFCTDLHTQTWSRHALRVFGLSDMEPLLPVIAPSAAQVGAVTPAAAQQTGLAAGTPVVTGAHDVDAAALGIGAAEAGTLSMVLGTFSINQVVADTPVTDPRWQARPFLRPAQWLHMSTSPSGASNLEWAVRQWGPLDADGAPAYESAIAEAVAARHSPTYLPFLYGAPYGVGVSAAFTGVRGWHTRGDLLRGVLEGVVFNHRWHVDALADSFDVRSRPARVCGGGARSAAWTQMLADALDTSIEVTDAAEAGARGAALLAGVGAGVFGGLDDAVARSVRVIRSHTPNPDETARLEAGYARYRRVVDALADLETEEDS